MQLGIFSKTFTRPTLDGTLDAIVEQGLRTTQFNLACAGLPALPDALDPATVRAIRRAFDARGLAMAALSGTFNMIHPDRALRQAGLRRLGVLMSACRDLGAPVITLCTGTRDLGDMWRRHPDNDTEAAWADLVAALETALVDATRYGVTLAFEPEPANVVNRAARGRRLLDQIRSPQLKVVIDGANLLHPGDLPHQAERLDEAFALLGPDVVLAHAKDLDAAGTAGGAPAGRGCLDWDRYLALLRSAGFDGALVLHGLAEADVPGSVAFLRQKLAGKP